jgi:hypothetical protein
MDQPRVKASTQEAILQDSVLTVHQEQKDDPETAKHETKAVPAIQESKEEHIVSNPDRFCEGEQRKQGRETGSLCTLPRGNTG